MRWPYVTPGIPDEEFERAEGIPMTKAEVRALALSRMRLREDSAVLDVGCGTGSVSVEAALLARRGVVYAVDRDPAAVELTRRNAERFGVAGRVVTVLGEAPEALAQVPEGLHAVFVGGTGGRLEEIVAEAFRRLAPGGRLVLDAISLDTAYRAVNALRGLGARPEVVQVLVAVGRETSAGMVMLARNPIYVISAER